MIELHDLSDTQTVYVHYHADGMGVELIPRGETIDIPYGQWRTLAKHLHDGGFVTSALGYKLLVLEKARAIPVCGCVC